MRGAYLAASHTAREGGEIDSAMRRYVPQPSGSAPARFHALYCALPGVAGFDGYAKHGECARHRRPGLVPQHAARATARPTTRTLERRNAMEQGQSLG